MWPRSKLEGGTNNCALYLFEKLKIVEKNPEKLNYFMVKYHIPQKLTIYI